MSMTVSAVRKGSIRTGPASKPSPRRIRPKCSQFLVSVVSVLDTGATSGVGGAREELSRASAPQALQVLLVLDDQAEGRLDGCLVELGLVEGHQRPGPIEGLGDARQLIEVEPPDAADKGADLA